MKQLPVESVHCVVTSIPYWGLRSYGTEPQKWADGWIGELGNEPTIEMFVSHILKVFKEVWRILRSDGTAWLNVGDTYNNKTAGSRNPGRWPKQSRNDHSPDVKPFLKNLPPKNLCLIPARIALALQTEGWYVRSDIIWHKPNPMPESVTDRPIKSHEYIWLLTKSAKYFYDNEAIKEDAVKTNDARPRMGQGPNTIYNQKRKDFQKSQAGGGTNVVNHLGNSMGVGGKRNKRDVWTIPTQSFSDAHFATFPEELVENCIKAGTSEKGCCPKCGKPWVRVLEPTEEYKKLLGKYLMKKNEHQKEDVLQQGMCLETTPKACADYKTVSWKPTCKCEMAPIPCIVLDPFFGSGTTGLVAYKLRRDWLGIELKPEYVKMANNRIAKEQENFALIESA